MPLNYNTIRQSLYSWASLNVPMGMPVIFYEPNAPRPIVPYVTLYLSSITQINEDYTAPKTDSNGIVFMRGDRSFILQTQAYGGDHLTVLENLRTSLQKETVLNTLAANGIIFNLAGIINDITTLVDSQFERRAQLDITFSAAQRYNDDLGYFDHLELQQIYLDPAGAIVYDETIDIPEI